MTPLDRKELAARLAAADLANSKHPNELDDSAWANGIVRAADALMARLESDAAPSRPKWVRITGPANAVQVTVGEVYRVVDWHETLGGGPIVALEKGKWYCYQAHHEDMYRPTWEPAVGPEWVRITGPDGAEDVTVGKAYRVIEWIDVRGGRPMITSDAGREWVCAGPEEEGHETLPTWKPCAAPEPAEKLAPSYVPKVGDKVRIIDWSGGEFVRVVVGVKDDGVTLFDLTGKHGRMGPYPAHNYAYVGPTTPAERTAAGLPPVDSVAPYVPRVGDRVLHFGDAECARVVIGVDPLRVFYINLGRESDADQNPGAYHYDGPATPAERAAAGLPPVEESAPACHGECDTPPPGRCSTGCAPDERPAFDEAKERDAARTAWKADDDVGPGESAVNAYIAGWIARARVAAKGGVS